MGKNFLFMCAMVALILGFFAMPALAEDAKKDEGATEAPKPTLFSGVNALNFWGGTNLRLYSKLYEGGAKPYDAYLTLEAKAGVSIDTDNFFWALQVITSKDGSGTSTKLPFNFFTNMDLYLSNAYTIWHATDTFDVAFGRFSRKIDSKKKFMIAQSPLTFHGDYNWDGFGFFPQLMNEDDMVINAAIMVNYLGKFLYNDGEANADDKYSHFWLIGAQPQMHMKMDDMSFTGWFGFWVMTHPDDLAGNSTSSTVYGTDAYEEDGELKDANLMMAELYGSLTFGAINVWAHVAYNLGAESQNAGMMLGLYYGKAKKAGEIGFGAQLFYIDKYMWFDKFVDDYYGTGQRGVLLLVDYCIVKDVLFYAQMMFKNKIGGGDGDGMAYFKIGFKTSWKASAKN